MLYISSSELTHLIAGSLHPLINISLVPILADHSVIKGRQAGREEGREAGRDSGRERGREERRKEDRKARLSKIPYAMDQYMKAYAFQYGLFVVKVTKYTSYSKRKCYLRKILYTCLESTAFA